jgi:pimeloyl-ACP methyl ester carboxylesterase
MNTNLIPVLEGVEHRMVDLGDGVIIHVAEAGPADGPPVMLVHGFPQNWWQWRDLIRPLAADGYRVLCPDMRGAGWSSAPDDRYLKDDMADDLAAVQDRLGVGPVRLVAHDWGGPVAMIMLLHHPEKVTGFFGLNTLGPWALFDLTFVRRVWRLWYQMPMVIPVVGPRVIGDPKGRYLRMVCKWAGGGYLPPDFDVYIKCMGEPGHAVAGSRWYRTAQNRELLRMLRGDYAHTQVEVPVRWLVGLDDPVITPMWLRGYDKIISDCQIETVDGVGHWIAEQRPELVLDRLRSFLRET